MNCPRAENFPDIFHVEGLAWELLAQTGTMVAVNYIPQILAGVTEKVAKAAEELHKHQVCGLILAPTFKFNKCFYTTRSICKILQSSVNSSLRNWTGTCLNYVRAGLEAIKNNTKPPEQVEGICEDYQIQYPPITESQTLLATLQTEGNLAGTGPIYPPSKRFIII